MRTNSARTSQSASRAVWIFAALSGSFAAGHSILFTISADYRTTYGVTETGLGWLIGVGFLTGFVAQVLFGPAADRGHARSLIVFGVGLNIAGMIVTGVGETFMVLLAGRITSGIGIGIALPALRRVVILLDPDEVGANLGRLLAADLVGIALGPVVSFLLVDPFSLAAPFLTVAAVCAVLLVAALTQPIDETEAGTDPPPRLALDLLKNRSVAAAVMIASGVFVQAGAFDVQPGSDYLTFR